MQDLVAFVKMAAESHLCIPPLRDIRHSYHYWIKEDPQVTGSADAPTYRVLQWSPSDQKWYHSNEVATYKGGFTLGKGYSIAERVYLPNPLGLTSGDFEEDLITLCRQAFSVATGAVDAAPVPAEGSRRIRFLKEAILDHLHTSLFR